MSAFGIIFDLDGTILDSMSVWNGVAEKYLGTLSVVPESGLSAKLDRMSFAEGVKYVRCTYLPDRTESQISDGIFAIIERAYRYEIQLKAGMGEFIEKLSLAGIPMSVATSNMKKTACAALERVGILPYFSHIITSDEVSAGKDSPEIYFRAAKLMNVAAANSWVIEDAPHAVNCAKSAGFKVAAVRERKWAGEWGNIARLADFSVSRADDLKTLYEIISN